MLTLENTNPTPLDRDLVEHKPGEPDRSAVQPWLHMLFPETRVTWSQVLEPADGATWTQPVLFTAASGSGKSTELHFLAQQLREEQKPVLAVEARRLATGDLEGALDGDELASWQEWKSHPSAERPPLYLLIDAVDELYLGRRNLRDLSSAMRANELLQPNVRLVVASRDDTCGPPEKQWLRGLVRHLQMPRVPSQAPSEEEGAAARFEEGPDNGIASRTLQNFGEKGASDEPGDFRDIKLAFLSSEQVVQLSTRFGLAEADRTSFLEELIAAEVQNLFPLRPRDVGTLVGYWQAHGDLNSWTDILEWQVRNAFQELNPDRGRHRELSLERYTMGIRRIAAVTTFSELRHVLRPDSATVNGAPHAEDLFPEWKPEEIKELFASPLLVRKGPASDDSGVAVQIVQGELSNFLAAHWARSVYLGGAEDAVLKSLFVVPPEHDIESIPEDRRNVAGWLAGILPAVRKKLVAVAPEVMLYRGDPACLSGEEVSETVQAMLQRAPVAHHEYGSNARIRRITRPELSSVVVGALCDAQLSDHLAYELIEISRRGAFPKSVGPALEWAKNEGAEEYTRKRAVELVAELGGEKEKKALLLLLGTDAPPVRIALFRALVPQHLFGDRLVDFLARENKGDMSYEIQKRGLPLSPSELVRLASCLTARLLKSSQKKASDTVYDAAEDGTAQLAVEVLRHRSSDHRPLEGEFFELLMCLECHELHIYVDDKQGRAVRRALNEHHWESVWEARLRHEPIWDQQLFLCPMAPPRFDWVTEKLTFLQKGTPYDHLHLWTNKFLETLSDTEIELLKTEVSVASLATVEDWQANRVRQREAIQQHEDEREREKASLRVKNDIALRPHLEKIRRGEHQGALNWAYPHFPDSSFSRPTDLLEVASPDVAEALTVGFRNWWRKCSPTVNSTKSTYGESWGLLGISLEVSAEGLSAIQSEDEVRIATLLAIRQLNSLPDWLKTLHAAQSELVENTLRDALVEAWGSKTGRASFISHLYRLDAPDLINAVARIVFALLGKVVPESVGTLDDAIDLALRASAPPDWLSKVAAYWTKKSTDADHRNQWLRLWCHSEGGKAADWLVEERKSDPSWDQVIQEVCQKVEWDLDRGNPAKWSLFFSTPSLQSWLPLLFELAPREEKFRRSGRGAISQAWTEVDYTREVLDAGKTQLVADGSTQGTRALRELSADPDERVSTWARRMIPFQRANAVKLAQEVWDVEKVLEAERFARRIPLTTAELCDVVLGEICRIDARMREGDFSYPEFFTPQLSENEIQRWVAAQLELVGKRTFYIAREPEVKDGNKMDIVALRPSLGRVPIEIKPIFERTNYSLRDLEQTIDDQLIGKYMRPGEVTHGVLLLVRLMQKNWELNGQHVEFAVGVDHLRAYARQHGEGGNTVAVAVIDIEAARPSKKIPSRRNSGKAKR